MNVQVWEMFGTFLMSDFSLIIFKSLSSLVAWCLDFFPFIFMGTKSLWNGLRLYVISVKSAFGNKEEGEKQIGERKKPQPKHICWDLSSGKTTKIHS